MGMPIAIPEASLVAEAIVLSVLCTLAVVLRFVSRYASKTPLKWDDWLIIPALSVTLGMAAVILVMERGGAFDASSGKPAGLGGPPPGINPGAAPPPGVDLSAGPPPFVAALIEGGKQRAAFATRTEAIFQIQQILSLAFLKASVLFFYRRLFCTGQRTLFDWVTRVLLVVIAVWGAAFLIAGIATCPARLAAGTTPALSDPAVYTCSGNRGGSTGGPLAGPFAFIVSDVITDFVVLAIPIPIILRLQMAPRRKLALLGVFALGGLACVSSVLRLAGFASGVTLSAGSLATSTSAGQSQAPDTPYPLAGAGSPAGIAGFASLMSFYSMLETGLALVAACLPTLRFLFTRKGWTGLRSGGKRISDRLAGSSLASTLRSATARGRPADARTEPKGVSEWSASERSTVVRTPSPVVLGRERSAERPRPDSDLDWAATTEKFPVTDADAGALEEGRAHGQRPDLEREGSEGDMEWLRRTVSVSRQAQARGLSRSE